MKKKKMAILYFSNFDNWPMGGILNYILGILPYLENKYEIDIWGCSVDGKELNNIKVNDKEYEIHSLGNVKTKKIIPNYLRYFWYMIINSKKIEEKNYDILYFHGAPILYAYMKKIKKSKSLIVYHQHGLSCINKMVTKIQHKAQEYSDVNFVNSDLISIKEHQNKLARKGKSIEFIKAPGPVNVKKFFPVKDKEELRKKMNIKFNTVFLFTGRIVEWKDPLIALEAFNKYFQEYDNNSVLYFIGGGDLEERLRKRISELNLDNNVKMLGILPQDEICDWLRISDVFVFPSKGEGLSISVAEAISCGVPVIGFDVIGVRELVKDGFNGYLLNERNDGILYISMIKAIENIEVLRKNTLELVEEYSGEKVAKIIIDGIEKAKKRDINESM